MAFFLIKRVTSFGLLHEWHMGVYSPISLKESQKKISENSYAEHSRYGNQIPIQVENNFQLTGCLAQKYLEKRNYSDGGDLKGQHKLCFNRL